jgi:hypothetical protein
MPLVNGLLVATCVPPVAVHDERDMFRDGPGGEDAQEEPFCFLDYLGADPPESASEHFLDGDSSVVDDGKSG